MTSTIKFDGKVLKMVVKHLLKMSQHVVLSYVIREVSKTVPSR